MPWRSATTASCSRGAAAGPASSGRAELFGLEPGPIRPPRLVHLPYTVRAAAIGTGAYHALVLTRDGAVWAWGSNRQGQLGIKRTTDIENRPLRTSLPGRAVAIAAGGEMSYAVLEDGVLLSWGLGPHGGGAPVAVTAIPAVVPGLPRARSIVAGTRYSIGPIFGGSGGPLVHDSRDVIRLIEMALVQTDGDVFSWGGRDGRR